VGLYSPEKSRIPEMGIRGIWGGGEKLDVRRSAILVKWDEVRNLGETTLNELDYAKHEKVKYRRHEKSGTVESTIKNKKKNSLGKKEGGSGGKGASCFREVVPEGG